MTRNRWPEIKSILDAALDLPPAEQQILLESRCAGDSALRSEVEAYLALDDDEQDLLETPILDLIAGRPPEFRAGQQVGAYRLQGEIARGGMGVVYEASRTEGGFEQAVAIKVLKRGFETGNFMRRFRSERQILADLDHPNIAHLVDGGATADGLPFLVMEKIDGIRVDHYCSQQSIDLDGRLALFLEICDAVHSAHQRLIVHCDLKPSNILVTADGRPKLLDFGIAKVLQQDADSVTRSLTLRLGTRPYASPEQLAGESITTAADIYSLGCLLFLLLTGRPPRSSDDHDLLPAAPSKQLAPTGELPMVLGPVHIKAWRERIRGDLDAIVLKAMARAPEQRYSSVAALADDLRRHLAQVPIEAKPPTWRYVVGLFLRRRRNEVAIAAVSLVLLLGAVLTAASLGLRARLESARANEMLGAYLEILEVVDPTAGESKSEAVRTAIHRLAANEPFSQKADMALAYDRFGRMLLRSDFLDEALDLLERSLELRRNIPDLPPEDLAASLNNLALVYKELGELDRAVELYEEALEIYRSDPGSEPAEALDILHNLGAIEHKRRHFAQAEALDREALRGREAIHGPESMEVARTLNNLAMVLADTSRAEEAEVVYRRSIEIREKLLGPDHPELASTLQNLATLLDSRGTFTQAIDIYQRVLPIYLENFGEHHPKFARTQSALALALLGRGQEPDLDRAETLLRQAVATLREKSGPRSETTWILERNLAAALLERGQLIEAESLIRDILERAVPWREKSSWRGAHLRSLLGAVLAARGRHEEARPLLENSLATLTRQTGADSRYTREASRRWNEWQQLVTPEPPTDI